eukprot:COSAG06_NODE_1126_length_10609_cov_228.247383_4_plen_108_part_00
MALTFVVALVYNELTLVVWMLLVIALQGTSRDDLVVAVHLRKEYKKEKKDKKKKKKKKKNDNGKDKKKEKEKKAKEDSKGKRSKTIAVEDLSLGLTPGECFGLLGPK